MIIIKTTTQLSIISYLLDMKKSDSLSVVGGWEVVVPIRCMQVYDKASMWHLHAKIPFDGVKTVIMHIPSAHNLHFLHNTQNKTRHDKVYRLFVRRAFTSFA